RTAVRNGHAAHNGARLDDFRAAGLDEAGAGGAAGFDHQHATAADRRAGQLAPARDLLCAAVPNGPMGAARAGNRPLAAHHVEGGEAEVLHPDRAEIERIGPAAAKLKVVVAGRVDGAADGVAGAESQRIAAPGELDRRAAGADDDAAVEDADCMGALDLDAR